MTSPTPLCICFNPLLPLRSPPLRSAPLPSPALPCPPLWRLVSHVARCTHAPRSAMQPPRRHGCGSLTRRTSPRACFSSKERSAAAGARRRRSPKWYAASPVRPRRLTTYLRAFRSWLTLNRIPAYHLGSRSAFGWPWAVAADSPMTWERRASNCACASRGSARPYKPLACRTVSAGRQTRV